MWSPRSARDCDVVFLAVSGDFALEWVPPQPAAQNRPASNHSYSKCTPNLKTLNAKPGEFESSFQGGGQVIEHAILVRRSLVPESLRVWGSRVGGFGVGGWGGMM